MIFVRRSYERYSLVALTLHRKKEIKKILFFRVKGAKHVEIVKRTPIERQILASTEFLEEIKVEGEEVVSINSLIKLLR